MHHHDAEPETPVADLDRRSRSMTARTPLILAALVLLLAAATAHAVERTILMERFSNGW